MKLISTTILTLAATTAMCFAVPTHDKYIIFGDSLTDTGSQTSTETLKTVDKPATNGGEIDNQKLVRNLGNNYWVPGDVIFPKQFQAAPITSFN